MAKKKYEKAKDFIGRVFNDGKLKVVELVEKSKHSKFKVVCKICVEDKELFPDGYFIATKESLVRGTIPCGCSACRNWSEYEYLVLANRAGEGKFKVHGFIDKFENQKSKLDCECTIDGYRWTPQVNDIINSGKGCPKCANNIRFTEEEAFNICKIVCEHSGYRPIRFPDGYENQRSRFEYECPEHGAQEMSFHDFSYGRRGCPSCSKYGYSPNKPGSFYISRWIHPTSFDSFIKFGITNNNPFDRVHQLITGTEYNCEVIYTKLNEDGKVALNLEKTIKYAAPFNTNIVNKERFKYGFTETIDECDLNRLVMFADDYFNNINKGDNE